VSAGSNIARLVSRRPHDFYLLQSTREQTDGGLSNVTKRYGPFQGAFFDPAMAYPGGPNTEIEDIRDDRGWRLNFTPLVVPVGSPDGRPGDAVAVRDAATERDSIDALDLGLFRVLKVSMLGYDPDRQAPEAYRAILERQT
jgi:hypothetical protein